MNPQKFPVDFQAEVIVMEKVGVNKRCFDRFKERSGFLREHFEHREDVRLTNGQPEQLPNDLPESCQRIVCVLPEKDEVSQEVRPVPKRSNDSVQEGIPSRSFGIVGRFSDESVV